MSRTPTRNPEYFHSRLDQIAAERDALLVRCEKDGATERDVAVSAELVQRYLDTLDEILDSDMHIETGNTVLVDGEKVRFASGEQFTEFLVELMSHGK